MFNNPFRVYSVTTTIGDTISRAFQSLFSAKRSELGFWISNSKDQENVRSRPKMLLAALLPQLHWLDLDLLLDLDAFSSTDLQDVALAFVRMDRYVEQFVDFG